jgi:hypothetical protein
VLVVHAQGGCARLGRLDGAVGLTAVLDHLAKLSLDYRSIAGHELLGPSLCVWVLLPPFARG